MFKIIPTEDYLVCSKYDIELTSADSGLLLPQVYAESLSVFKVEGSTAIQYDEDELVLVKDTCVNMQINGKVIVEVADVIGRIEFPS